MNIHNAEFIKSTVSPSEFIRDGLANIVFSGRSNVGKSSVINRLTGRKNFARVGSSPGKTIHINYFLIDKQAYFVDLPGYGYAKVSKTERERWGKLMERYFESGLITFGVMIVDARHKPTQDDVMMANWYLGTNCPMVVAANKCDKLKKTEQEPSQHLIRETLGLPDTVPVLMFSAEKGTGRDELLGMLKGHVKSR